MTTRNTVPKSNGSPLKPIVSALLSTKLNYLQQQETFVHRAYADIHSIDPTKLDPASQKSTLKLMKERLDDFLSRLEQLAHAKKLLLLIRRFLNESTALAIYELLTNDKYLFYSENSLRSLLSLEGILYESARMN